MEKLLQSSLRLLAKVDLSKYGWVLTTASIVAYLCLQKNNRSSSDYEEDNEGEDSPQDEKEGEEEMEYSERSKREGCLSTTDDSSNKGDHKNQRIKGQQQEVASLQRQEQLRQLDSKERNQTQINSFNNNNLKKQYLEKDKKLKKLSGNGRSNNSSSSSSNLKILRARKTEFEDSYPKQNWDAEEGQTYAYSDIESRSYLQAKQQNALRKQRRYTSDTEETSQDIRRNRILKIARESAPKDGLFFQVLASLAENDEENE